MQRHDGLRRQSLAKVGGGGGAGAGKRVDVQRQDFQNAKLACLFFLLALINVIQNRVSGQKSKKAKNKKKR